jgi:hypothetical protein
MILSLLTCKLTSRLDIHRQIVAIARTREALLLTGFSAAEKDTLLKYLRRMQDNIPLTRTYKPVEE